jgi:hypothetical protein
MDIRLPNSLVNYRDLVGESSGGNTMTHKREREISQDTGTTTVRPHLCLERTDREVHMRSVTVSVS